MVLASACTTGDEDGRYVGYVEGEYVYVGAPRSGWIVSMPVAEGDVITAGDIVFELDDDLEQINVEEAVAQGARTRAEARNIQTGARPEELARLQAVLSEAEAGLILAESEYDRVSTLVADEILPPADGDRAVAERNRARARVNAAAEAIRVAELSGRDAELDAAQASIETADTGLRRAEWHLDQRSVESRVDGRVESILHRHGEFVTAGSSVLSILPPDALKIRFFLPVEYVSDVAAGNSVQIFVAPGQEPREGVISFIASDAEFTPPVIYSVESREKLVFMVEARLIDSSGLRPGVPVDVQLQ